jgi:hypothetical protein
MRLKWLIFIQLIGLLFPVAVAKDSSPSFWWAVELRVSVQGDYRMVRENLPVNGRYQYRFFWRGSMERDNGDYILYQGDRELLSLIWHEAMQNRIQDLSSLIKPDIFVNYVVRKEGKLHVDFNIRSALSGAERTGSRMAIHFPQSAEHERIDSTVRYNRWIEKGSNEIAVAEDPIYSLAETNGQFKWDWCLKTPDRMHNHSVQVEFRLFRKPKK